MPSQADFETASQGIYPGPDLEWFAVDEHGNVGAFCNAGLATVPAAVFGSFDLYTRTLDAVDLLPKAGKAIWYRPQPPIHDTWDRWSERGLFGFDWNHGIGQPDPSLPYVLMTRPEIPVNVSALPDDVAAYVAGIRLPVADSCEILI